MSNLINYKGFEIPQPTPANLGGEALANNFKRLGDLLSVTSATFYVDNTRIDVFEPGGSVLHPFLYIQDAIDAALALADGSGGTVSAAMHLPNGALLLAGQTVSETGAALPVTVASPALQGGPIN